MSAAASGFTRNVANYHPTIWGNAFLQYASESMKVDYNMELQKVGQLKEEVQEMLVSSIIHNLSSKLKLIDNVQRLSVSYHFEREIDEELAQIHSIYTNNKIIIDKDDDDLHSLALLFRLLRQQGYPISSDVFNKFKNENGNFNENLANDVEGMLALYEASQLRVHGEDILDEALHFTSSHLKSLTDQLSPSLAAHVNHCLRQPLHKGLPRIEARYYMSFYQEDPSHSDILLTFAKLDFSMLQKLHQRELGNITKWWKKSDFVTKVPYSRDRLVEAYFWPLAVSYEPHYSTGRMIVGKLVRILCLLDDTYDVYGTLEELELFTEAIHRWDIGHINSLPQCMKEVFKATQEVCREMELVTAEGGTSCFVMQHVKRAIQNLSQSYLVEAKWRDEGYVPTYDEYKDNGVVSSTLPLQITSFLGLGKFATEEVFGWIFGESKIIRAMSIVGRLLDDMATHKERVHVASGVECCMKQYGISEEAAYKVLQKDLIDCWKDINEVCLKPYVVPKPVLDRVVNLARVSEVVYENFQDRFTNGELLKDLVLALLVDPIAFEQHK